MAIIGPAKDVVNYQVLLAERLASQRIDAEAAACGHQWRQRLLGPAATVHLWLMQVLLKNVSMTAVRHLSHKAVTASALCQAKAKLPRQLLLRLNELLLQSMSLAGKDGLWKGLRVLGGDGVCYYTPDSPELASRYGRKKPFGYPLMKVVTMFDLYTGALLHQIALPNRRQEAPLMGRLLRLLGKAHLLVLDRAYPSYANFADALDRGVHVLARLKINLVAKAKTRRKVLKKLGKNDRLVQWQKPKERPAMVGKRQWARLPQTLVLRQISVNVTRAGIRTRRISVLTTLLDPVLYPAAEIANLYARRWEVETHFRHLKTTLNLEHLRSQSIRTVRNELLVRSLAYNLVRTTLHRAARQLKVDPSRVSFADTLHLLLLGRSDAKLHSLIVNPLRLGRSEPRRLKRQNKNYMPLNCSRAEARKRAA